MPPEARAKGYQCPSCSKEFNRSEHLRRHALVHSETRPYQCRFCTKDFVRRDALTRHVLTHENRTPSLLQRGRRACLSCQRAKVRCSGDERCSRCLNRDIQCEYPVSDSPGSGRNVTPGSAHDVRSTSPTILPAPSIYGPQQIATHDTVPSMPQARLVNNGVLSTTENSPTHLADMTHQSRPSPIGTALDQYRASLQEYTRPRQPGALPLQHLRHPLGDQLDPLNSGASSHPAVSTSSNGIQGLHAANYLPMGKPQLEGPAQMPLFQRCKPSTTAHPVGGSPTPTSSSPDSSWSISSAFSPAVFEEVASLYRRLCVWPPAPWNAFKQVDLPDMATFGHFLRLYYLHFDQTLPFWHAARFEQVEQHPVLIVVMSAIGCSYADGASTVQTSLLEFGRRALIFVQENTVNSRLSNIPVCAAHLLQIVGMAYSEHENFRQRALDSKRELSQILDLCQRELKKCSEILPASEPDEDYAWITWCHHEGLIRLASSTWLVDCMLAYHFESKPSLGLRDMQYPLPCSESLWSAKTAQGWRMLWADSISQPSLSEAMQQLYVDKRLPQQKGEFARILLMHGLYQRTWEVQRYFENPLSSWEPSDGGQSSTELLPKAPVYLPSIPEVSSWQSAACDALTIMHWQANDKIGRASGHEHATVLHLHVARIVLLTPYGQIVHLARTMGNSEDETTAESKQILQRWVGQHQRQARIATVHAGLVFWHIRRSSLKGFYEAHSVALAALVLWAFGIFSSGKPLPASQDSVSTLAGHEDSEQSDDAMCEIILIDRPTDEELVQQFIQNGSSMRIHMTGVEDLYGPRGPESVLVQACKLLSSLAWGSSASWLNMLQRLADVSRRRRERVDE